MQSPNQNQLFSWLSPVLTQLDPKLFGGWTSPHSTAQLKHMVIPGPRVVWEGPPASTVWSQQHTYGTPNSSIDFPQKKFRLLFALISLHSDSCVPGFLRNCFKCVRRHEENFLSFLLWFLSRCYCKCEHWRSWNRTAAAMPYEEGGATPRNMGTQCENTDVENQNTVGTVLKRYFGLLGVRTSDPLLKVVIWIAFISEVHIMIGGMSHSSLYLIFYRRLVQLWLWYCLLSFMPFLSSASVAQQNVWGTVLFLLES